MALLPAQASSIGIIILSLFGVLLTLVRARFLLGSSQSFNVSLVGLR
jgi:hypothetical protein